MKTNIIDNTDFPVRKVAQSKPVAPGSVAYQAGLRFQIVAECGHGMATKLEEVPETVKCWTCHKEGRK